MALTAIPLLNSNLGGAASAKPPPLTDIEEPNTNSKLLPFNFSGDAIASKIGEKKEDVVCAREAITEPISLYEPIFNDSGDSMYIMDQISDSSSSDEMWVEDIALKDAMKKLSEREKKIIDMRYYIGKTQSEIAKEIGISQAQVSRLEKNALNNIRLNIS